MAAAAALVLSPAQTQYLPSRQHPTTPSHRSATRVAAQLGLPVQVRGLPFPAVRALQLQVRCRAILQLQSIQQGSQSIVALPYLHQPRVLHQRRVPKHHRRHHQAQQHRRHHQARKHVLTSTNSTSKMDAAQHPARHFLGLVADCQSQARRMSSLLRCEKCWTRQALRRPMISHRQSKISLCSTQAATTRSVPDTVRGPHAKVRVRPFASNQVLSPQAWLFSIVSPQACARLDMLASGERFVFLSPDFAIAIALEGRLRFAWALKLVCEFNISSGSFDYGAAK